MPYMHVDVYFIYGCANGNGRAAIRMYPDRRMPDHRFFQRLHRQLREARMLHVTRHDAGRRKTVRSPSLEASALNVAADGIRVKYKSCSSRKCESSDLL
ncbi:hypothetical protein TNCV_1103821 [Trichonephila clavipes]|nr:hypothetical protein TNCV_1103821 [Trichonephila clavipes]